jgi:hypothetical protein
MIGNPVQNNLGDWQHPPVIQNKVIAYIESLDCSFTLRDIYHPLRLPRYTVNRVLGRLHSKGVLTRYKIPVPHHRYDRKAKAMIPGGTVRQCYLYRLADEGAF